jgi:hypothetical protein
MSNESTYQRNPNAAPNAEAHAKIVADWLGHTIGAAPEMSVQVRNHLWNSTGDLVKRLGDWEAEQAREADQGES